MRPLTTIVYNASGPSRYDAMGEARAVAAVLEEVEAVQRALETLGYRVARLPLAPPMREVEKELAALETGLAFNLFEGFDGQPKTEPEVAGMLASRGIPYTGNPPAALALCLDKLRAKEALRRAGVETPRARVMSLYNLHSFDLGFPCIVKPRGEDASHGLSEKSVVHDSAALARQVGRVSRLFGGSALVEEFIDGREFNVTVMGNDCPEVLPVSEILYDLPPGKPRLLTYGSKWDPNDPYFRGSVPACPAELTLEQRRQVVETASRAFKTLGCQGYARVDLRLDEEGVFNVLEVNPNPDISPDAGAAIQAKAAGMSYEQFIERIVELALEGKEFEAPDPALLQGG